jgi:membrane-associated phospholipid phosphatase
MHRPGSAVLVVLVLGTLAGAASPARADERLEPLWAVVPDSTEEDAAADSVETAPPLNPQALPDAPRDEQRKRSLGHSLTHGAHVFLSDGWFILSSPTRMSMSDAMKTTAVFGVAAALYLNDQEIHDQMQAARGDPAYEIFKKPGRQWEPVGYMGNTNKYYVAALVTGYTLRVEPLTVIPAQILESHMISAGIRNMIKPLVGRTRPFDGEGPHHFEFLGPGTSFPSGHASVDFELATILSHHVKYWPIKAALYYAAASMAAQRVESDGHWMSDVWLSSIQGYLVARTVVTRHDQRVAREKEEQSPGSGPGAITGSLEPQLEVHDGVPMAVWTVHF